MFKLAIVGFFVFFGSVFAQNDTALWQAAGEGNLDAVKEALARGANPNWEHPDNMLYRTALAVASWFNHPAIVSALLDAGADKKRTALICAIMNNVPAIVNLLLNAGADPNAQDNGNGMTMLYMATWGEHIDVVKALLEGGADPNFQVHEWKTRPGYTPLFAAAYAGNVAIANVLFDAHANVTIVADDGSTALHHAVLIYQRPALADESNQQMIQRLLRKGADVNQKDIKGNTPSDIAIMFNKPELANIIQSFTGPYDTPLIGTYTPVEDKALWQAALDGNLDAVNGALARGANPNTWGKYDNGYTQTALNVASHNNDPAVVSALLDAGADNTYGRGTIALNYAAQYDALEVVKVLLNAGADPNVQENGNGRTSLYIAAGRGNIDVINALLEGGADPNIQRFDVKFYAGYTPLFEAAYTPAKISIFKALIDANANVGIVADDGSTVLHHVVSKYSARNGETNQQDIVRLLLWKGADLNQKDNEGSTPSDIALHYFKPELANIIENYKGPYDTTTTTTTPVYDLYLMACRVTKLIAETLYSALN